MCFPLSPLELLTKQVSDRCVVWVTSIEEAQRWRQFVSQSYDEDNPRKCHCLWHNLLRVGVRVRAGEPTTCVSERGG